METAVQAQKFCGKMQACWLCSAAVLRGDAHIEGLPEAGRGGRAGDDQVDAVLLQKLHQALLCIVLHGHPRR